MKTMLDAAFGPIYAPDPSQVMGYVDGTETTIKPLNQQPGACPWCSSPWSATFHGGRCPKVKSIEYGDHGEARRIEFYDDHYDHVTEVTC